MRCGSIRPVVIFRSACDVAAVDPDRHAARAFAQIGVLARVAVAVVVLDPVVRGDLRADHFDQFGRACRPMQPGGDQDQDLARAGCPPLRGSARIGLQDHLVRHRPGDVADEDARALLAASQFRQRRRADRRGEQLVRSGPTDRAAATHLCRPARARHALVRQFDIQPRATVFELDAHGRIVVLGEANSSLGYDLRWRTVSPPGFAIVIYCFSRSRIGTACRCDKHFIRISVSVFEQIATLPLPLPDREYESPPPRELSPEKCPVPVRYVSAPCCCSMFTEH